MTADNWISKIRLKRKQKREAKMKEALSFLLDEIKETEDRAITRITAEMEHDILPQMEDSVQKMNRCIDKLSRDLRESNSKIEDLIIGVKKQCVGNNDATMENLHSIVEKIEQADANLAGMQNQTESLLKNRTKTITLGIDEVKSLLQVLAVNSLIDEINVTGVER